MFSPPKGQPLAFSKNSMCNGSMQEYLYENNTETALHNG